MKEQIRSIKQLLLYNWRTLFEFELLYKLLGLSLFLPVVYSLFYFSIRLYGTEYLITSNLISYITSPFTILIFLFIFGVGCLYFGFEIIVLTILFNANMNDILVGTQSLIIQSLRRLRDLLRTKNRLVLLYAIIFVLIIEITNIIGSAVTITVPVKYFTLFFDEPTTTLIYIIFIITCLILLLLSFNYVISVILNTENKPPRVFNKMDWKTIIKRIIEFVLYNVLVNIFIYMMYILFIGIILLVFIVIDSNMLVYAYALRITYDLYLVIAFVASTILIPINLSWLTFHYYKDKSLPVSNMSKHTMSIMKSPPIKRSIFYRLLFGSYIILILFAIIEITTITNQPVKMEALNAPKIVSHRGGGVYAPENTIKAIEQGIILGADSIEIDVRFTSDGVPVLLHDETLQRTTNGVYTASISTLTYEEIKDIDVGSYADPSYFEERIPTLEEVLNVVDGKRTLLIEVKDNYPNDYQIILDLIEEKDAIDSVIIISFNKTFLQNIKEYNHEIKTLLLISEFIGDTSLLSTNPYYDYYGFRYSIAINNKDIVRSLQQHGKQVYVWTVNDKERISEMNQLGVNGIITDYPVLARETIYTDFASPEYIQLLRYIFRQQ